MKLVSVNPGYFQSHDPEELVALGTGDVTHPHPFSHWNYTLRAHQFPHAP